MDTPCCEPHPFELGMFLEKHNGPGIKYEVAVCIKPGWIVWANGPFKAGVSEKKIF